MIYTLIVETSIHDTRYKRGFAAASCGFTHARNGARSSRGCRQIEAVKCDSTAEGCIEKLKRPHD